MPENKKKNNKNNFQVYGKYSLGSGGILSDDKLLFSDIGNQDVVESYTASIMKDLEKAGIPAANLKKYKILDVGTGRQAIAFFKLGAKKINHYDISEENVEKLNKFIKLNKIQDKIESKCVDLVKYAPPKNNFDLVFLHGIVQHFSDTGKGLKHCLEAVKVNGYISLYFYRSGTFFNFVVDLIRDLIGESANPEEYFVNAILLYSDDGVPNHHVSDIMDSFFVSHINLYAPEDYLSVIKDYGFKVVSSSKLDPCGRKVDHTYAHPSVVITCKKVMEKNRSAEKNNRLSPAKCINQLDESIYSGYDEEIFKTITDYKNLKSIILEKNIPSSVVMAVAFKIYKFLQDLDNSLSRAIIMGEGRERHRKLQNILIESGKIINQEF